MWTNTSRGLYAMVAVGAIFYADTASAWGPRAQQSIAMTAMRLVKQYHPTAFGDEKNSFEKDVVRGAGDGVALLRTWLPMQNDVQSMAALESEIQLLRSTRAYGIDAYFCYRMGVLGALAADLSLPIGIDFTSEQRRLLDRANVDIDAKMDSYSYAVTHPDRRYMRSADQYFADIRRPFPEMARLIAADYATGLGLDGILKKGGPGYFSTAIESAADAWFTIMRHEGDMSDIPPSQERLTWYFANKVEYALEVMDNLAEAERAYKEFRDVNPGVMDAYETVGDLFYDYNRDTQDRGVREWERAIEFSGPNRRRVVEKLSNHYLDLGKNYLQLSADKVRERDKALPASVQAFADALKYDRANQEAADLLSSTNNVVRDREARRQTAISLMSSAESVLEKATKSREAQEFSAAYTTYARAQSLFESIDPEFPDQEDASKERISEIRKGINAINTAVLDKATEAIAQGDRDLEGKKFAEAVDSYSKVEGIVTSIPLDEKTTHGRESKSLIDKAKEKVQKAEQEKKRFEEAKKKAEEDKKKGAGKKPAATAPKK